MVRTLTYLGDDFDASPLVVYVGITRRYHKAILVSRIPESCPK